MVQVIESPKLGLKLIVWYGFAEIDLALRDWLNGWLRPTYAQLNLAWPTLK